MPRWPTLTAPTGGRPQHHRVATTTDFSAYQSFPWGCRFPRRGSISLLKSARRKHPEGDWISWLSTMAIWLSTHERGYPPPRPGLSTVMAFLLRLSVAASAAITAIRRPLDSRASAEPRRDQEQLRPQRPRRGGCGAVQWPAVRRHRTAATAPACWVGAQQHRIRPRWRGRARGPTLTTVVYRPRPTWATQREAATPALFGAKWGAIIGRHGATRSPIERSISATLQV